MNLGIIIVSNSWINQNIVDAAMSVTDNIVIHCYGLNNGIKKINKRNINCYKKESYRSYAYVKNIMNAVEYFNKLKVDYIICIHGDVIMLKRINILVDFLIEHEDINIIEQYDIFDDSNKFSIGRVNNYYFGFKMPFNITHMLLNKFNTIIDYKRFRFHGIKFGHDAWIIGRTAIQKILNSDFAKRFYKEARFSIDPKNFYIHTLMDKSNVKILTSSPELYQSRDFRTYNQIYHDQIDNNKSATNWFAYPLLQRSRLCIKNNDDSHTIKKQAPQSRKACDFISFGAMEKNFEPIHAIRKPFFCIYAENYQDGLRLAEMFNDNSSFHCHGDLCRKDRIDYLKAKHEYDLYKKSDTTLRDYSYSWFIYNMILKISSEKFFGFMLNPNINHRFNYICTKTDYCFPIFMVHDSVLNKLIIQKQFLGRHTKIYMSANIGDACINKYCSVRYIDSIALLIKDIKDYDKIYFVQTSKLNNRHLVDDFLSALAMKMQKMSGGCIND